MKNDLKILAVALEKKLGKAHVQHDEKHSKTKVLHKVWDILKGKEKAFGADTQPLGITCRLPKLGGFPGSIAWNR